MILPPPSTTSTRRAKRNVRLAPLSERRMRDAEIAEALFLQLASAVESHRRRKVARTAQAAPTEFR